jgi:membrane protease subunit (stomatin/prohibitin family)
MTLIKFVRNYNDESTERGFQFEFYCDRCGTGYRTSFKASATGVVSEALDVASGLLGGVFGKAASVGDRIHSAAWEKAHDKAFTEAVTEVKPNFVQCPRCTQWVCRESCWNNERGLCKECAPDVAAEYAAAQVETEIEQGREIIRETQYVTDKERLKKAIRAACPACGAAVSGGKFCPECGAPFKTERFCTECGAKIAAEAKFCTECGAKQA